MSHAPKPLRLKMVGRWAEQWVSVAKALPPPGLLVLVMIRGDDFPALGHLKYGAGDPLSPYFVCPQIGAMAPRGLKHPEWDDITHWYAMENMPPWISGTGWRPPGHASSEWGLGGRGWVKR